ncbi:MAG: prolyl oligopeptidase family serine peptidase [Nitrospina sp.]|nr:prolyl oligopeptidase family serine peptidase [Nitrospina sp.]
MTEFVYLHGFASGPLSKKAAAFKKKFEEIGVSLNFPDLEGGDFENMTLTSQIKIVLDLLDQFQGKNVCLIGSSMGGYLATLLAQKRGVIKATYLMAPGFNFLERWMRSLQLDYDGDHSLKRKVPIFHYRYDKTKYICTDIFKDAKQWASIGLKRDVPTRIVHGTHDKVVPINESIKFVSRRPWCSLKELDCDHGLLSHLDWIVDDCIAFFKKLGVLTTQ